MTEPTYDPDLITQLGKRRKRAMAELEEIRTPLNDQIVAAGREGVRQADLVKTTGITRDNIRKLWRANGIEAA